MAQQKKKPDKSAGNKTKEKTAQSPGRGGNAVFAAQPVKRSVLDDICAILLIGTGAFFVIAFQTNAAGALGSALANGFKGCFGAVAYMIPYYLIIFGVLMLARKTIPVSGKSAFLVLLILLMCALINSGFYLDPQNLRFGMGSVGYFFGTGIDMESGGLFGMFLGTLIVKAVGIPGLYIFSVVTIIISLLLVINTPISQFFERAAERRRRRREMQEMEETKSEDEVFEELTAPEPVKAKKKSRKKNEDLAQTSSGMLLPDGGYGKNGDVLNGETLSQPNVEKSSYVQGKISRGQQNILDYMKSDSLYGISASEEPVEETEDSENREAESSADFQLGEYGFCPAPREDESFFSKEAKKGSKPSEDTEHTGSPFRQVEAEKLTNSEASKAALSREEFNTDLSSSDNYKFPPLKLLHKAKNTGRKIGVDNTLQVKARKLEQTLQNFHIDAKVIQVTQGPAITRYEIQPNVGVKVKSIVNLADDIALNLEAKSIRIEAPIPGKAAVGIEVENDKVNMVTLREIIDTEEFRSAKSKITFAVGKDIAGKAITADLKAMPHLLIAGSTGSGKSVCVNSIITSILYKAKPDEVKLVLIDPKVVELANYNGIPHLLIPVVTEPSKAAAALNWAVAEMDDRYKKFAAEGVRDLESYNNTVKKRGDDDLFLPQVVIIIDELADLMMAAPSQVEESICRLAQKARAAGMHLIVATQRPSVDIITGVIKANIPSRIAFAVSSQFDSRTILDMSGAEKLVGKGDMLFNPIGGGKPHRVQGTFVSDEEVHDIIEFVKGQTETAEYSDDVLHTIETANVPGRDMDGDELLADAIEFVVLEGAASSSKLQRRFRVGYNRAARMIDMMEERGIVGPPDGSKPRQVLMTEAELNQLQNETEEVKEG